jgi:putative addiction module component (TIGR02574 family)
MQPGFSEIFKLSIAERILLVEALWDSIAKESQNKENYILSEEQIKLLEEEMALYAENKAEGTSWPDIKEKLLRKKGKQ